MCLAVVALRAHPRYALVVAANRDEFHARAAVPAAWGTHAPFADVFAGRDLTAGGTWLGLTRSGRFAFVTNVREPGRNDPAAPSRGELVPLALRHDPSLDSTRDALLAAGRRYNGFNLVLGDGRDVLWLSNRAGDPQRLGPGVYGLSNAALDTPWPKLERTRHGLAVWAQRNDDSLAPLFDLLADRRIAPDAQLPSTGVPLEWERRLSAPFIVSPNYGTRCTTVLAIGRDGRAWFLERSFDATGAATGEVATEFAVSGLG
jgi:uncharacterized protein with NRDE domain